MSKSHNVMISSRALPQSIRQLRPRTRPTSTSRYGLGTTPLVPQSRRSQVGHWSTRYFGEGRPDFDAHRRIRAPSASGSYSTLVGT